MRRWLGLITFGILISSHEAMALGGDGSWTFAPVMGVSQPSLTSLYNGVFRAPFRGTAEITTDLPSDTVGQITYPRQDFVFFNYLPKATAGPEAGLEFRRLFGPRNDFIIGISSWEIRSKASMRVAFPMQGAPDNEAIYERRGDFSYTQYYVGWRRYFYNRKHRRNVYFTISFHEAFDVDYKEENIFSFTSGDPAGFKRIVVIRSQATGVLMLQGGVGAELRLADRFSVGMEASYAQGIRKAPLKGVSGQADFNEGDRLRGSLDAIMPAEGTNNVIYLREDRTGYDEVRLDFSGWKALLKFNVDF